MLVVEDEPLVLDMAVSIFEDLVAPSWPHHVRRRRWSTFGLMGPKLISCLLTFRCLGWTDLNSHIVPEKSCQDSKWYSHLALRRLRVNT